MTDRKIIMDLVAQELEEANKKYPLFRNPHEAWAVLKEEVEELEYETFMVKDMADHMWAMVKCDMDIEDTAFQIYTHAVLAAQEAIQVAAMCDKIKQSNIQGEEEEEIKEPEDKIPDEEWEKIVKMREEEYEQEESENRVSEV